MISCYMQLTGEWRGKRILLAKVFVGDYPTQILAHKMIRVARIDPRFLKVEGTVEAAHPEFTKVQREFILDRELPPL